MDRLQQFMKNIRTRRDITMQRDCLGIRPGGIEYEIQDATQTATQMARNAAEYALHITQDGKLPMRPVTTTITLSKICGGEQRITKFSNGTIFSR